MVPKSEDRRKYQKRALPDSTERASKRARTEPTNEITIDEDEPETINFSPQTPLEANEKFINDNLTIDKAIYLIFTNIPKLPLAMPASFHKDYAKFVLSGRIGKSHLAEALAAQFVEAKVGPGVNIKCEEKPESAKRKREIDDVNAEEEMVRAIFIYFLSNINVTSSRFSKRKNLRQRKPSRWSYQKSQNR